MPWLIRDGEVLAALEVADSFDSRLQGLLGRDHVEGALLLPRVRSVHSFGMRFTIDVAFCDRDLAVLETVCLRPWRLTRPRLGARAVIEAAEGAFERWRLRPGDHLEIKG